MRFCKCCILTLLLSALLSSCNAQTQAPLSDAVVSAIHLSDDYKVIPNIVYHSSGSYDAKLDVYQHTGKTARPTLIYIHGGAWRDDRSKDQYGLWAAPFLHLGWDVVNVEYRSAGVAHAPAAVEDCLCAMHWVFQNAKKYAFDTKQVVVMGHSAGGHLALMVGMAPPNSPLQNECPHEDKDHVAAIIDWFGITDVADMLGGPDKRAWAQAWVGDAAHAEQRAREVSPFAYVRTGLPPTILIHGDSDPTVPYQQAVALDAALKKASVPHDFVTIPGGKHGFYGHAETERAYTRVFAFLQANGLVVDADKGLTKPR
jgi:acetyl esterase/lipase